MHLTSLLVNLKDSNFFTIKEEEIKMVLIGYVVQSKPFLFLQCIGDLGFIMKEISLIMESFLA